MNTQKQQYANMYTDSAQFLDKGRQCRKKVQNITKLDLNSLPTNSHETSVAELQHQISLKVLIYTVQISTSNKQLIKTDLPLSKPQFQNYDLACDANSFKKRRTKF